MIEKVHSEGHLHALLMYPGMRGFSHVDLDIGGSGRCQFHTNETSWVKEELIQFRDAANKILSEWVDD